MIQFDASVCRDLSLSSRREWLETNGIGGYASSTIAGLHTRRYHGLLVAATRPPVGRMVLLSHVEETLVMDHLRFDLSVHRYPGVVHPQGHLYLKEFRQDPWPVFVYEVDGVELEKSVFLVNGENTVVVQYAMRARDARRCTLELRPLIGFRDYHSTTHENSAIRRDLKLADGRIEIEPYDGLPRLSMAHNGVDVQAIGDWYRNFEYPCEQERGLDFREDLFCPAQLTFDLQRNSSAVLIASTQAHDAASAPRLRAAEIERRSSIEANTNDRFLQTMMRAADQYLVRRGAESTVIAGYHWFSDWGRDTMIALPGLTLVTGRHEVARSILLAFAEHADRGMLPNRFPDAGEGPEYNTVDATLWFFEAVRALAAQTGDYEFIRARLYPSLTAIISWHERGTRYGIHLDSDGLLLAGDPGSQLTWMDAKVGDWVVTPRHGKPVEIQALWYNALRVMENFSQKFGQEQQRAHYQEMAERVLASFLPQFWNHTAGCLYDVVNGEERDASIRPNQIFAASLFYKMLPREKARRVVEVVQRELLTPYGLRSLAPSEPRYRGRYEGDPLNRDGAYHQGTVWPWLMGPFITAYLEANGRTSKARAQASGWISELQRYVADEGLGQIPEVFDGDAPHRAGGCMAQAWSVAELLRCYVEDVAVVRPARRMRAAG